MYNLSFNAITLKCGDLEIQKTHSLTQFLSYRPVVKTKIMAISRRSAWRHYRVHPINFRSCDVTNVIFGKTATTHYFF